ncbi:MAG: hypothetical protein H7331_01350 [Bacteroidia bacterium]|nr:hypothetical protein [Bacteroidia bacterium]
MKHLIKVIVFAILMFAIHTSALAQQGAKTFTTNNDVKYLEEVKEFFTNADKDYGKKFYEEYELYWNSNVLSKDEKSDAVRVSNLMLKRRLKPLPDFENYYKSLMLFTSTNHPKKSFETWQFSTDFLLNGKLFSRFVDYVKTTRTLLESNIIYSSQSTVWQANNNGFVFEFDSLPRIRFAKTDLSVYAKNDTSTIYNTSGLFYPITDKWIGTSGRVKWTRANFSESQTWADINPNTKYKLDFKGSSYKFDSVTYYNTKYFSSPLLGTLEEKCYSAERGDACNYPKFDSYTKRFKLPNLSQDIDYEGGFSMHGAKFIGSGTKEEKAQIKIKVKGKVFFIAQANGFIIRPEKIVSQRASIIMYNGADSISHPGLVFKLDLKERKVTLIRDEEGKALSPFYDSFHKIDLYPEALYWTIDEPLIEMKTLLGGSSGSAQFESQTLFKQLRYEKMAGMDDIHPLQRIKMFSDKNGKTKTFDANKLANFMQLSPDAIKPFLMTSSNLGIIDFDTESNQITLKDRFYFFLNAANKRVDYDVIEFNSDIKGASNATLNLLNWDLKMRGVERIQLSDSQNVFLYPKGQELVMQKNRFFKFAGRVYAGRFEFFGKDFSFDYANFKINLVNTDSLRFKVLSHEPNANGEYDQVRCKSVVENINGELLIDNPLNKSGAKSYPQYPIFNCNKPSFVYYDKASIMGGTYKRDKFYFQLDPFTIDSLDNFTNSGVNFEGTFVSAGIFPTFKEKLRLQKDYSLGFIHETPAEGFPMYSGKGTFITAKVKLSNAGLRGEGDLKYITSTTSSTDFKFYPDSMNCVADKHVVEEQKGGKVEYPHVESEKTNIHWLPSKDKMYNKSTENSIKFYDLSSKLTGTSLLEPSGMSANGRVDFNDAAMISTLMTFKAKSFDADTADFELKDSEASQGLAFNTKNVKAHIDFEKRLGEFTSNGGASKIFFPQNKYMCFMDKFTWFMDKKSIELSASEKMHKGDVAPSADIDIDGPEFISTHENQDSLRFKAMNARYDLKSKVITCQRVKLINVADARVYPDSGNVIIRKDANMDELRNCKIAANSVTKYHEIYNATAKLFSRKSYTGSGTVDYTDELKQKFPIKLNKIDVDTTYQTFAEGDITDDMKFKLSPQFEYIGKVKLQAANEFLYFKGGTRLVHTCDAVKRSWMGFESAINPKEILIPITKTSVDRDNNKMASGLALSNSDSTYIYAAFASVKENYSDQEVISAEGFLAYDKPSGEYRISSKEKLAEQNFPGNYLSLSTKNCVINGEGKFEVVRDMGQVKVNTVGNATYNLVNKSVEMDILMALDFFFDESAIKRIYDYLDAKTDAEPVSTSRKTYERGLREMLPKEEAEKLISQLSLYGSFKKFPSELEHTIMFNELKLKWNQETRSFVSIGKLGIGSIYKNQVNKKIDGYIEVIKKRSGEQLNMYLKFDDNLWYYFNYANSLMQSISSDEAFNTTIKTLKSDKRKSDGEKGQKGYTFILSTEKKKKDFVKKMEKTPDEEKE